MRVDQFHSGAAYGDAITNFMISIRDFLRQEGFESDIYVESACATFNDNFFDITAHPQSEPGILLVHHSMGINCFDKVIRHSYQKILIYHNITPERYVDCEYQKKYVRLGIKQLYDYRLHVAYALAVSNYNRREMRKLGYTQVDVMPIFKSLAGQANEMQDIDRDIIARYKNTINLLFVGRIVPHKCQHDLIDIFKFYHQHLNKSSRLFLIGDDSSSYCKDLKKLCGDLGIDKAVIMPGKISSGKLNAFYEIADVYISMSEHEGFGVPLIEAMERKVPVIAYGSSAVPETLGGAGLLVGTKDPAFISFLIDELLKNKEMQHEIIAKQSNRLANLTNSGPKTVLLKAIGNVLAAQRKESIQIVGQVDSSYSLAIVNRNLTEAFYDAGEDEVSISTHDGFREYTPETKMLSDLPVIKILLQQKRPYPDVTIRNTWPPVIEELGGSFNFQFFAWEETLVPEYIVNHFNQYLDGIGVATTFIKDALLRSGIRIPIRVVGHGAELPENYPQLPAYHLKTKKTFKFLHISSALPRKGVDILLRAYYSAFSDADDVALVIKTFPNPHNTVPEIIGELKRSHPNPPQVILIIKDISSDDVFSLYKACDCYVHVARGEGFGLPVAEAMICEKPVIVSPNTGLQDFCNERTALLVNYQMEPSRSHVAPEGSFWAEPNEQELRIQMKYIVNRQNTEEILTKIKNAKEGISKQYSWKSVKQQWRQFINEVKDNYQYAPQVAMVSTWNTKCGIAEYSRNLVELLQPYVNVYVFPNCDHNIRPDEDYVAQRVWTAHDLAKLEQLLVESHIEIVHLQVHPGIFAVDKLSLLLKKISRQKKVVLTLHTCAGLGKSETVSALNSVHKMIVHREEDREYLGGLGIARNNIKVIPHGLKFFPNREKQRIRENLNLNHNPIIASYGFLLPHKGILEVIQAIKLIKEKYPDILYVAACSFHGTAESLSRELYDKYLDVIKRDHLTQNVKLITDYLADSDSLKWLQAADIIALPYYPTTESASGALKFCLGSHRPVITTKQPIFNEAKLCSYQIDECTPGKIASAVEELLTNDTLVENFRIKQEEIISLTDWRVISKMHTDIYQELMLKMDIP